MPSLRWMTTAILFAFGLLAARAGAEAAKRPKEPARIVDETVTKVIGLLEDPVYKSPSERAKRREKIRLIMLDAVDMDTLTALTLANFKGKFSPAQLEKFQDLFSRLIFSTYITHLESYSGEKVVVIGAENQTASRVRVRTKTVTDTKEIPVEFSFTIIGDEWKLYDVYIEGVSLVKNYRSQFREILVNRSAEQFLERLRQKVEENEKEL